LYHLSIVIMSYDIGIPLWFCENCDAVFHSNEPVYCPKCAHNIGDRFLLTDSQKEQLLGVVELIDEHDTYDHDVETESWWFHNLLEKHLPWYNMESRLIVQACWFVIGGQDIYDPKFAFAYQFFQDEYNFAPHEKNMYFCDVVEPFEDGDY
jgi:hypothetical protein